MTYWMYNKGKNMLFLVQPIVSLSHVKTLWLILLEKYEKLFLFGCYNVNLTKPII